MFTKASIVTLFAGLAAAQIHAPTGNPAGNPINKPLNEVVPACKPFTISWTPTTSNTVSVLLLKGPSTNVVKFGPSLAEGIVNSGSLSWTPSADLEATSGPTGYGIQLVDDVTGQYQYSTQFGISKEGCAVSSSSVVASSTVAASSVVKSAASTMSYGNGYPSASPVVPSASPVHAPYPSKAVVNSVAPYPTTLCSSGIPAAGTGVPAVPVVPAAGNGTAPTGYQPAPSATGAYSPHAPEFTGAASTLQAGLSLVGAAAAVAFML